MNLKNESITTILKPWARDANNKELKTFYTVDKIDKNILQQHIATNDMTYPTWCGNVVSDVKWAWRNIYNGIWRWSLRITPTWCGITASGPTPWGSWQEVYDKTPFCVWYNKRGCGGIVWDKRYGTDEYWSMYNQYVCHTDGMPFYKIATKRSPWEIVHYHLDPWRKNAGYVAITNWWIRCNNK